MTWTIPLLPHLLASYFDLQTFVFLLQPLDNFRVFGDVRIDVDDVARDVAANIFGPIGVIQGIVRIVRVEPGWRHGGDHHRPTIPAQTVLQQSSQVGIAKVDVFVALK